MYRSTRARMALATILGALLLGQALTGIASAAPAKTPEQKQLDALYAAAKKEGRINLYSSSNDVHLVPAVAGFKKRWPGIRVSYTYTTQAELLRRFAAEASAKVTVADVLHASDRGYMEDAIRDSWLVALNKANLPGGFPGPRFPKQWVVDDGALGVQTITPVGFSYNTRMVKGSDIPTTYTELLDPKWSGKIISAAPPSAGAPYWDFWDFIERSYGPSFLTKFKENKPIWYATGTPAAGANGAGEAPLMMPAFGSLTGRLKAARTPVEQVLPATTTGLTYFALPVKKAAHPNAARLFVYDMYQKVAMDDYANEAGFVSPTGGGHDHAPKTFVTPQSVVAGTRDRQAYLAKLLGLKY